MLRGHYADDDLRTIQGGNQIARRGNRFRQNKTRKEMFVDSTLRDALDNFCFIRPKLNFVRSFTSKNDCECRTPGSRSDHSNAAHWLLAPSFPESVSDSVPRFIPNFNSLPAAIRLMFWRCFQITSADTIAINIICRQSVYSLKAQVSSGKAAAPAIDASDTYRNANARIKNSTIMHNMDFGVSNIKAPRLVATPLPPRNLSHTGKRWPQTAKNAAMVMISCG